MTKSISASELSSIVASGKNIELIDVRTPMEFRAMHVTIARNEPLSGLDPKAGCVRFPDVVYLGANMDQSPR